MPSVFGVRAGFDVDANHIFPRGVLDTVTLIECVAGMGGAREPPAGCEAGPLSAQWPPLLCQEWGLLPSYWSGRPEGLARAALSP